MANPYRSKPSTAFWRTAVAELPADAVDPVVRVPFRLNRNDRIATAGSCFAQRLARALTLEGYPCLVTETGPRTPGALDQHYGVYPARFGELYTVGQLHQLFKRAYGLFDPAEGFWMREDGRFVDPFRPRIQDPGFASVEALEADREAHLAAVREMFERCDVLTFTLGLTEGWRSRIDGAAVPFPPGAVGIGASPQDYSWVNSGAAEVADELMAVIDKMREVNPTVRVILTVSPVPIVATYGDEHVLAASTLTKAKLRVAADMVTAARGGVAYFPSFEAIMGAHQRSRFFADNLREITSEGVAHVMTLFKRHYMDGETPAEPTRVTLPSSGPGFDHRAAARDLQTIICDEDVIETA